MPLNFKGHKSLGRLCFSLQVLLANTALILKYIKLRDRRESKNKIYFIKNLLRERSWSRLVAPSTFPFQIFWRYVIIKISWNATK